MKQAFSNKFSSLFSLAMFGMTAASATGATLMNMTFDNGGANIDESATAGWDGTLAPGGSLATGLVVTSGMKIYGEFVAQQVDVDVFHVDNWKTTNSTDTRVGITVGVQSGYTFSLGSGTETFSTKIHQHPANNHPDLFNAVELIINGISISSQPYIPASIPQTLIWNIGSNPSLNNLTTATFDLKFPGISNPVQNNHGPEWSLADGAFVSFTGTVIPETSQAVLCCLGMALTLVRRKR